MANETVTPRIMAWLEWQDQPRTVAGIARGAQVSRTSVRKLLDRLDAAGQLATDRTSPGFPGYQLRPRQEGRAGG